MGWAWAEDYIPDPNQRHATAGRRLHGLVESPLIWPREEGG